MRGGMRGQRAVTPWPLCVVVTTLCTLCARTAHGSSVLAQTLTPGVAAAAASLLGGMAMPAIQFAARGNRGVAERIPYLNYSTLGPYAMGNRILPYVPKLVGDWSWEALSSMVAAQPFQTTFGATMYYPAMFQANDAPIATSGGAFPVIGWAVGWTCTASMYLPLFERLASHGFIVVVPTFNDQSASMALNVNFRSQTDAVLSSIAYVIQQSAGNATGFSFGDLTTLNTWHGRVDASSIGLAGHSAGGGVVIQGLAEQGLKIKAAATLGAWANIVTTPWLANLGSTITAPVMLLSGQNDTMAPVAENAQVLYDKLTSPKVLPILQGGTHCFLNYAGSSPGSRLADGGIVPWAGFSGCPFANLAALPAPYGHGGLGSAEQLAVTGTLLTAWFSLYLKHDAAAAPLVWGRPMARSSWMSSVQMDSTMRVTTAVPGGSVAVVVLDDSTPRMEVTLNLTFTGPSSSERWTLVATATHDSVTNSSAAPAPAGNATLAASLVEQLSLGPPQPTPSALVTQLSVDAVVLAASSAAHSTQTSNAALPRSPALPLLWQVLTGRALPPPPAPPLSPPAPARRLLLQADSNSGNTSSTMVKLTIDRGFAEAGNHTVTLAVRRKADGGTTAYAFIKVQVTQPAAGPPPPMPQLALYRTLGTPIVSALARDVTATQQRLANRWLFNITGEWQPGKAAAALWAQATATGANWLQLANEAASAFSPTVAIPLAASPTYARMSPAQQLLLQLLQLLSGGGFDWQAAWASARSFGASVVAVSKGAALARTGGAEVVPPPSPKVHPPPPPPTVASAALDFTRSAVALIRGAIPNTGRRL